MQRPGAAVRYWTVLALVSVAVAWSLVYAKGIKDGREADRKTIAALTEQVRQLGGTPVAGPSGKDGAAGPTGQAGRDGKDGRDGQDGQPGAPGPTGSPGPSGAEGRPGAAGATGQAGADGNPGPTGPTGQPGPAGPAGPKGERGEKGDTGEPGTNVTCAQGYHPEDIIIVPYKGTYQVCRKDDPADE